MENLGKVKIGNLEVRVEQGNKGGNDRKYYLNDVPFNLEALFGLNKLILDNEYEINKEKILKWGRFFFKEAMLEILKGRSVEEIMNDPKYYWK